MGYVYYKERWKSYKVLEPLRVSVIYELSSFISDSLRKTGSPIFRLKNDAIILEKIDDATEKDQDKKINISF